MRLFTKKFKFTADELTARDADVMTTAVYAYTAQLKRAMNGQGDWVDHVIDKTVKSFVEGAETCSRCKWLDTISGVRGWCTFHKVTKRSNEVECQYFVKRGAET